MENTQYISSRRIAIVITILVLAIGTIVYFATNIADRNNEMTYKEVYGENAMIRSSVNGAIDVNYTDAVTDIKNIKTTLV